LDELNLLDILQKGKMILKQIEDFMNKVQSLRNQVGHHGSTKEEKAFSLNAAKQFEETIKEAKNLNVCTK
jgi:hypothetical protein